MRAKRPPISKAWISVAITAVLGGSLVYYAKPIAKKLVKWTASKSVQEETVLATVKNPSGVVLVEYRNDRIKRKITKPEISLFHKSTLYLRSDQTLEVMFASNDVIRFSGDGQLTVELWDSKKPESPIYVNTFGLNHAVVQKGRPGEFYLQSRAKKKELMQDLVKVNVNNGESDGLDTVILAPNRNDIGQMTDETPMVPVSDNKPMRGSENKITNGEIQNAVEKESESLRRCLVNSLRQGSGAEGQMLVAFKILPNGKTKDVQIVQDHNKNQTLSTCVQSVFARLKFLQFSGPAIMASYPLNFE